MIELSLLPDSPNPKQSPASLNCPPNHLTQTQISPSNTFLLKHPQLPIVSISLIAMSQ